jgi:hypothetical protein
MPKVVNIPPSPTHPWAYVACGLFLLANVTIPFTLGDVYPFTVAPMFRDAPREYENIRVFALDGTKLADNSTRRIDPLSAPDPFRLRRYYDGNPVGYGVGVRPPATLDVFGEVHSEASIREHILQCLREQNIQEVEVEQEIVGPIDAYRVGVVKTQRWRVSQAEKASP